MNGAPEGEIFEVTVLADHELRSFSSASDAETYNAYNAAHSMFSAVSATWADKYSFVELVRSISFSKPRFLVDNGLTENVLKAAMDSVESLRSSEIRNGILALGILVQNCMSGITEEQLTLVAGLLVNKLAGGPRFICSLSSEVLAKVILSLAPLVSIRALMPHVQHKNAEAASIVVCLLADRVVPKLDKENADHLDGCRILIGVLSKGLNGKRATTITSSKAALSHLRQYLGEESFQQLLASATDLDESKRTEIVRVTTVAPGKVERAPINPISKQGLTFRTNLSVRSVMGGPSSISEMRKLKILPPPTKKPDNVADVIIL
jgi:hypothetical protein